MKESRAEGSTRKVRSDKKTGVLSKLDNANHDKLVKLALSLNMTKTKLAEKLIKMCLNNPETVNFLQARYNTNERHKISPVIIDGKEVEYMYFN